MYANFNNISVILQHSEFFSQKKPDQLVRPTFVYQENYLHLY
jgi:hypothetical protein